MNCKTEGCKLKALASEETCWFHLQDKDVFRNKILEKAQNNESFAEVNLANVDFSNLELKALNFRGGILSHCDFSNATLWHCEFQEADLTGANLSFADLSSVDFSAVQLFKANLTGARCWNVDFSSANLVEANLAAADLLNAKFYGARLWHANIVGAHSLSQSNFEHPRNKLHVVCAICEKRYREAKDTYTMLKQYFIDEGSYNDVHWASFREMSMQRMIFLQNRDLRYIPSLLMSLTSGYAEKPWRVIMSSMVVILLYAGIYRASDAIVYSSVYTYRPNILDTIYYSIVTFTTLGYGDFIPKANSLFRFLAGSEAFIGAFMMGLFVFTLARRYSAR